MDDATLTRVQQCFEGKRYEDALAILQRALSRERDWNTLHLAGQACRFLNQLTDAEQLLESAVAMDDKQATAFLALGIVYQLQEKYEKAVSAFQKSVTLEPGHEVARNSLALTYRKMNRLTEALEQYEAALTGVFRRIALSLQNNPHNPVLLHRDTVGKTWTGKATEMMVFLAALTPGVESVAWPSGEQAEEESKTQANGGLLFKKVVEPGSGKQVLYFLPNYFSTVREHLKNDLTYAIMLNNIGGVLAAMGRCEEAQKCFLESVEFTPTGTQYQAPHDGLKMLNSLGQ